MPDKRTKAEVKARRLKLMVARQRHLCPICQRSLVWWKANFDHIIPKSRGGSSAAWNLRATHPMCNNKRGATMIGSAQERELGLMHGLLRGHA